MIRRNALTAVFLLAAAAAWAQEAVTQPIPRSEIIANKQIVEGSFYWGENDEADADIWGVGGQFQYCLDPRMAVNAKLTYLLDSEGSVDIRTISLGAAIAYELIEPIGESTLSLTIFGGAGFAFVDIEVNDVEIVDDTDFYIETGIQADLKLSPEVVLTPFAGITFVFNGDSDTIYGLGGKIGVDIGPGWRFQAGAIFQFDDISEAWLLTFGVTKEVN